jgi:hypothetical protein
MTARVSAVSAHSPDLGSAEAAEAALSRAQDQISALAIREQEAVLMLEREREKLALARGPSDVVLLEDHGAATRRQAEPDDASKRKIASLLYGDGTLAFERARRGA